MTTVFAHHDESGKVHSLVAFDAPEGSGMSLVAKAGHLVSQVDVPTLKGGPEGLEQLRALARGARVAGTGQMKNLTQNAS
jgi:hypothetical protein